jgi:hypothetical protein
MDDGKAREIVCPSAGVHIGKLKTIKSCCLGVVLQGCGSVGITLFSKLDPFTSLQIGIRILRPVLLSNQDQDFVHPTWASGHQ